MWTHRSNFSYLHIGVGAVACNLSCRAGVHSRKLLIVDLSQRLNSKDGKITETIIRPDHVKGV